MVPSLFLLALALLVPAGATAQLPIVHVDLLGDLLPPGAVARFGTLRLSHPGVESLTFSPNGKMLVSGGGNGHTARLWDAATGKLLREIPVREGVVVPKYPVPQSPVPPRPGGREFGGRILRYPPDYPLDPRCIPVVFAPDGSAVLLSSSPCCRWWDPATGQTRPFWDSKGKTAISAAFAPDGKTMALALLGGEIVILEVATVKERGLLATPFDTLPVDVLAFAPDNRTLAVGFGPGYVWLWDCVQGKRLRWYLMGRNFSQRVAAVAFAADGKSVAVAAGSQVKRFETVTDGEVAGFHPIEEEEALAQLRLSGRRQDAQQRHESGSRLGAGTGATGKKLKGMATGRETSGAAALDHKGQTLAYAEGNSLLLLDAQTGKPRVSVRNNLALLSATFADGFGLTAACADADGTLHFWDTATGKEQRTLAFPKMRNLHRHAVGLSPGRLARGHLDERLSASPSRSSMPHSGKELWTAKLTGESAERLAFAPDGHSLAVVTDQGRSIDVWDVNTGKRRCCAAPYRTVSGTCSRCSRRTAVAWRRWR